VGERIEMSGAASERVFIAPLPTRRSRKQEIDKSDRNFLKKFEEVENRVKTLT
jgi:hypothetical protein